MFNGTFPYGIDSVIPGLTDNFGILGAIGITANSALPCCHAAQLMIAYSV